MMLAFIVIFFMALAAGSFALSLGYFCAAALAKEGEDYFTRQMNAVGHMGWGLVYLAVDAVILMVNAVLSL